MDQHPTEAESRRNIQRYLLQLSFFEPTIPAVPVDGISGEATTAAIKAFQRLQGFDETGLADDETFDSLYIAYLKSVEIHSPPASFSPFPRMPLNYSVKSGETAPIVKLVQFMLTEISSIYDSSAGVTESGIYDDATMEAVGDLQYRNLLPVTGEIDRATWNALVKAYEVNLLYIDP